MATSPITPDTHNIIQMPSGDTIALPKDMPDDEQSEIAAHVHYGTDNYKSLPVGNSNPQMPRMATPRDYLDDPKVQMGIQDLYDQAAMSFNNRDDSSEHLYSFDKDGNVTTKNATDPWKKRQAQGSVPGDSTMIVHTHPASGQNVPSPGDYETATKLGKPNFVVSRNEIYVALPGTDPNTNKHVKVADIKNVKGHLQYKWK